MVPSPYTLLSTDLPFGAVSSYALFGTKYRRILWLPTRSPVLKYCMAIQLASTLFYGGQLVPRALSTTQSHWNSRTSDVPAP
eukprot:1176604-Rhodomonas_salina.1